MRIPEHLKIAIKILFSSIGSKVYFANVTNALLSKIFFQSHVLCNETFSVSKRRIRKSKSHIPLQKLIEFFIESSGCIQPMCCTLFYKTTKDVLELEKDLSQ